MPGIILGIRKASVNKMAEFLVLKEFTFYLGKVANEHVNEIYSIPDKGKICREKQSLEMG